MNEENKPPTAAPLHGMVRRSVFAFEFCFCRFESGFSIESVHLTKAGAYRAMMEHKRRHWYDARESRYCDAAEIGWMEMWRVREYTVAD
jgi:hypothetical protein